MTDPKIIQGLIERDELVNVTSWMPGRTLTTIAY